MSDAEIIEHLRFEAPTQMLGKLMLAAARRLEQLTAAPDGTINVRVACVASKTTGQSIAVFIEPGENPLDCLKEASRYVRNPSHQCLAHIPVPQFVTVPVVQAQIESMEQP